MRRSEYAEGLKASSGFFYFSPLMSGTKPPFGLSEELVSVLGDDAETLQASFGRWYDWMVSKGKNPRRSKGLAEKTSANYCDRLDQAFRFIIYLMEPDDMTTITDEEADLFIKWLDEDEIQKESSTPYSETAKRKFSNAIEKYFIWRKDTGDIDEAWTPDVQFSQSHHDSADKLSFTERWQLREAALDYGSLPSYASAVPEERDEIKGLVAQRLGKPKEEVKKRDWERADSSTEVGSLVAVGLETGITPVEVEEARVHWYDKDHGVLEIPNEYASKNRPTSRLPLTDDTAELMSRWKRERRHYEKYDGSNRLWLNQKGNPYDSANLCDLVRRLCDEAGINYENRRIVWYSVRHNVGQSIEEIEDLSEARDQLRHDSIQTTKKFYGKTAIESRRQTLEKINTTAQRSALDPNFNPYADESSESKLGQTERKRQPDESSRSQSSKSSGSNEMHIDQCIKDTTEARNRLAQDILSGSGKDESA